MYIYIYIYIFIESIDYILLSSLNLRELKNISKTLSVKETGPSYGQKFVFSDNPSQKNWHKVKKYSKIEQYFKNVISNFANFACFLTAIVNV